MYQAKPRTFKRKCTSCTPQHFWHMMTLPPDSPWLIRLQHLDIKKPCHRIGQESQTARSYTSSSNTEQRARCPQRNRHEHSTYRLMPWGTVVWADMLNWHSTWKEFLQLLKLDSPNKNNPCLVASEQEQPKVKRNNQKTHGSAIHEILRISGIKPGLILFRKITLNKALDRCCPFHPVGWRRATSGYAELDFSPKLLAKLHLSTCATGSTRPTPSIAKFDSTNIFYVTTSSPAHQWQQWFLTPKRPPNKCLLSRWEARCLRDSKAVPISWSKAVSAAYAV